MPKSKVPGAICPSWQVPSIAIEHTERSQSTGFVTLSPPLRSHPTTFRDCCSPPIPQVNGNVLPGRRLRRRWTLAPRRPVSWALVPQPRCTFLPQSRHIPRRRPIGRRFIAADTVTVSLSAWAPFGCRIGTIVTRGSCILAASSSTGRIGFSTHGWRDVACLLRQLCFWRGDVRWRSSGRPCGTSGPETLCFAFAPCRLVTCESETWRASGRSLVGVCTGHCWGSRTFGHANTSFLGREIGCGFFFAFALDRSLLVKFPNRID